MVKLNVDVFSPWSKLMHLGCFQGTAVIFKYLAVHFCLRSNDWKFLSFEFFQQFDKWYSFALGQYTCSLWSSSWSQFAVDFSIQWDIQRSWWHIHGVILLYLDQLPLPEDPSFCSSQHPHRVQGVSLLRDNTKWFPCLECLSGIALSNVWRRCVPSLGQKKTTRIGDRCMPNQVEMLSPDNWVCQWWINNGMSCQMTVTQCALKVAWTTTLALFWPWRCHHWVIDPSESDQLGAVALNECCRHLFDQCSLLRSLVDCLQPWFPSWLCVGPWSLGRSLTYPDLRWGCHLCTERT